MAVWYVCDERRLKRTRNYGLTLNRLGKMSGQVDTERKSWDRVTVVEGMSICEQKRVQSRDMNKLRMMTGKVRRVTQQWLGRRTALAPGFQSPNSRLSCRTQWLGIQTNTASGSPPGSITPGSTPLEVARPQRRTISWTARDSDVLSGLSCGSPAGDVDADSALHDGQPVGLIKW